MHKTSEMLILKPVDIEKDYLIQKQILISLTLFSVEVCLIGYDIKQLPTHQYFEYNENKLFSFKLWEKSSCTFTASRFTHDLPEETIMSKTFIINATQPIPYSLYKNKAGYWNTEIVV